MPCRTGSVGGPWGVRGAANAPGRSAGRTAAAGGVPFASPPTGRSPADTDTGECWGRTRDVLGPLGGGSSGQRRPTPAERKHPLRSGKKKQKNGCWGERSADNMRADRAGTDIRSCVRGGGARPLHVERGDVRQKALGAERFDLRVRAPADGRGPRTGGAVGRVSLGGRRTASGSRGGRGAKGKGEKRLRRAMTLEATEARWRT